VQSGTPEELFEYPQTIYVGQFIGSPAMNFFDAEIGAEGLTVAGFPLGTSYRVDGLPRHGLRLGLRPEYLEFVSGKGSNALPVTITDVQDQGSVRVVGVAVGEARAKVKLGRQKPVPQGEAWMRLPVEKIRLYVGGELLRT
jgi:glycerol transport system ATP-binding protein